MSRNLAWWSEENHEKEKNILQFDWVGLFANSRGSRPNQGAPFSFSPTLYTSQPFLILCVLDGKILELADILEQTFAERASLCSKYVETICKRLIPPDYANYSRLKHSIWRSRRFVAIAAQWSKYGDNSIICNMKLMWNCWKRYKRPIYQLWILQQKCLNLRWGLLVRVRQEKHKLLEERSTDSCTWSNHQEMPEKIWALTIKFVQFCLDICTHSQSESIFIPSLLGALNAIYTLTWSPHWNIFWRANAKRCPPTCNIALP